MYSNPKHLIFFMRILSHSLPWVIQVVQHALLHQWIPAVMSLYQILMVVVGMEAMERIVTETVMIATVVVVTAVEAAMTMVVAVDARRETVGTRMEVGTVNLFSVLATVTASATVTAITTSQKRKYHHLKKAE
jgi:hypothetical protein